MTHNKYILFIAFAGLISWIAFYLVINKLDPFESMGLALGMFFISLFFALVSTFTVIGFYLRLWLNRNEIYYNHINISLRQGILLTMIAVGSLLFQLLGVLTWWSGLLLIGTITMIEFYIVAKE
ncbi:hypothetical protein GF376_01950 [Candidatus Peregrinibacteria bacterium]|nr:hypothetical protein [Candidatus Peregrinibacteria bacterium]